MRIARFRAEASIRGPQSSGIAILGLVMIAACAPEPARLPADAGHDLPGTAGTTLATGGSIASGGRMGAGGGSGSGGVPSASGGAGVGGGAGASGGARMGGSTEAGGTKNAGGATGAGGVGEVDAGSDVASADVPVLDAGSDAIDTVAACDSAGLEALTVKDPYFTTTEESDGMHAWYLPWADHSAGPTDMSGLNSSQEVVPLTIGTDGHIYRNGARYRLFGANHFGYCSPSHETADLLAQRVAKFGLNAMRFQGCDGFYDWPYHRELIDYSPGNGDTLDKVRLDRFDYLLAALRKRGVYFEVPLLNSRRFLPGDSGDPANPLPVPAMAANDTWASDDMQMNQMLGFILDPVVAAQQRYAKSLLGHVNPYTGLIVGKDPAVAFVEIANETGLVHYWMWQRLDKLDGRILAELARKWNVWLLARYTTTTALESAWGGTPAATELLANPTFATPLSPWNFYVTSPAVATTAPEANADGANPALRIDTTTAGTESWHVQLLQSGLTLAPGQTYRFSFRAKASTARAFDFNVSKSVDPWTSYTPWQTPTLGTDWQDYAIAFIAPSDVSTAADTRAYFAVGPDTGTVWISKPSLQTGGPILQAGESVEAGTVPLIPRNGARAFSKAATLDYIRFLRDTETSYWKRMSDYLKNDLGVTALVVGSQIITSPPTVQAAMDAVDNHSYWDQPQFPDKMWDPVNWLIDNQSVVYSPPGILDGLGSAHVTGKPFLATEATHAHPNEYSGEGALLTAAYGSLQDLDLFLQHEWGWQGQYDATALVDYFDFNHHPPKLVSTALVAKLFRSFEISPAKQKFAVAMDPDRELAALFDKGKEWRVADASTRGFPMAAAAISRVEMSVAAGATDSAWPDVSTMTKFASDTGELSWDRSAGIVTVNSAHTRAVVGFASNQGISLGGPGVNCTLASGPCVTFTPSKTLTGHSVLLLELVEGDSFTMGAGRALLSATGDVRNTEMQWNANKTSLGGNWGHAPTRVEVIAGNVALPRAASDVAVYALDGRGQRIASVPVTGTSTANFAIGGSVPTLWYEVVLGAAAAKGEGNHTLDACAAYCASVASGLPNCYPSTNDCLEDCATFTGDALGGHCDCAAEVDAVFACEKTNTARICGRLSQGVPPSNPCLSAFLQAFKCSGKVAPCTASMTEELVDDFEDGDLRGSHPAFAFWTLSADASTPVTPNPLATSAHGANGSGQALHVSATLNGGSGYANVLLSSAQPGGVDLSGYAGIAFSARGVGWLRASLGTADLDAAGNYNAFGKDILLTPTWRRQVIRFDDSDFTQGWSAATATFNPKQVTRLQLGGTRPGLFDFWVDDVVLVKL